MHWRRIGDSSKDLLTLCNSCVSVESLKECYRVTGSNSIGDPT
jgi:hypothetical protein